MTAYFDEKTSLVSEASGQFKDADAFLARVQEIEEPLIREVSLVTGDREFPDDMRERMQSAIANLQVKQTEGLPDTKGRDVARIMRYSSLVTTLHSLFHELASRRIRTRYGLLTDSPRGFLLERGDIVLDEATRT